jgi:hypothetical protein
VEGSSRIVLADKNKDDAYKNDAEAKLGFLGRFSYGTSYISIPILMVEGRCREEDWQSKVDADTYNQRKNFSAQ